MSKTPRTDSVLVAARTKYPGQDRDSDEAYLEEAYYLLKDLCSELEQALASRPEEGTHYTREQLFHAMNVTRSMGHAHANHEIFAQLCDDWRDMNNGDQK